jgi:hypothetical protein
MGYKYEEERKNVFTEEGQVTFLKVRDQVKALLEKAGAFRMDKLCITGDSFFTLACVDRLVELGEIVPLRPPDGCWAQYQVYADKQVHNY